MTDLAKKYGIGEREIKFRVWFHNPDDQKDGEWISISGEFEASETVVGLGLSAFEKDHSLKHCQYTGLKDKNGEEVYEGDIVNVYDNVFIVKYGHFIEEAGDDYYSHDSFGFYLSVIIGPNKDRSIAWVEGGEVIGNIFENAELINELEKGWI